MGGTSTRYERPLLMRVTVQCVHLLAIYLDIYTGMRMYNDNE